MKKVININFQGRVIPIEETAYDMLTKYVESLRAFFASEDGKDEIINDIEGRIAELFGEILKKGSTCIVDEDVHTIINSMGRPEDFEAEEASVHSQLSGDQTKDDKSYGYSQQSGHKKLYRDETHKVLGGVCAGIANYFGIDPLIVRILFFIFVGVTFWVYIILWIAVPPTSSVIIGSQRKRLFRDPDNKLIAGVCSGLAQYFSVQVWIPRILFLIPFFSFVFNWRHEGWWDFPNFLSFSFSPGSIFIYIIFWLVLPEAKSAADKLEMKGEKVDLNNIKSTIQGDMEGFKDRARQFGTELKDRAHEISENFSKSTNRAAAEANTIAKTHSSGIGRALALIVKIFVYFILGCILFSIVGGLFGLGVVCTGLLPSYSSYVLNDGFQNLLSWGTLIFFIWIPVIAIVTWVIRKLTGKKGNGNAIALTFTSLWVLGWVCFINLLVQLSNEFKYRNNPAEQNVSMTNPLVNRLEIKTIAFGKYYTGSWLRLEPFASFDEDTAYAKNVRLRIIKSNTDSFKVTMVKMANASTKNEAEKKAERINFNVIQKDSVLLLDRGIAITRDEKFRNQQVILTVAVPVGKRIFINDNVNGWSDVRVDIGRNGDDYWDWENNEETKALDWDRNVEYVMTETGLKKLYNNKRDEGDDEDSQDNDENSDDRSNAIDQYRKGKEELQKQKDQKLKELEQLNRELQAPVDSTRYHYNQPPAPAKPAATEEKKPKAVVKNNRQANVPNGMNDSALMKFAL